ncbi:MAG: hypothetical protein CBC01_01915 [Betaproteobacteria bacterium TMED41]|nr:MAG: hypothetical protein CBC01_01915 [Betaproteobacteria bacterium TMED41]
MKVAIFCKVIDNFGDAGFCLRLARSLANKVKIIEIFCDDIILIKKMSAVNDHNRNYLPKNLFIHNYDRDSLLDASNVDLVIEAYRAEPPIEFLKKIHFLTGVKRVILDYLVTEEKMNPFLNHYAPDYKLLKYYSNYGWVNSSSARRVWLAPGFTSRSAGLITGGWKKVSNTSRNKFRKYILNSSETKIKKNKLSKPESIFIICIFLYQANDIYFDFRAPKGFDGIAVWRPKSIDMNQIDFDSALQSCDFNCVRGEDSFLSAHNAAASQWKVPFVWQPYFEKNEGHKKKFEGWKNIFPDNEFHSYWEFARLVASRNNKSLIYNWGVFTSSFDLFKDFFHANCLNILKRKSLEQSILECVKADC